MNQIRNLFVAVCLGAVVLALPLTAFAEKDAAKEVKLNKRTLGSSTASLSVNNLDEQFERLKKEYFSLRNTDVNVSRPKEWEALAKRLMVFVDRNPKYWQTPFALYDSAVLYENLFYHGGRKARADRAIALFTRISRTYPRHLLADDALLKQGELYLKIYDAPSAERCFRQIISEYGDSNSFSGAQEYLETSEKKERKTSAEPERATEREKRKPLIVLDPGHGGEDFGAAGVGGLIEKEVVLAIALRLEPLLEEKLDADVRLTRTKDIFVPLAERTSIANEHGANLFISLHLNASPGKKKVSGFETYYLDNSGDQASKKLAERENASVRFEGPQGDLQFMLSDLIQNAKLADSIALANLLQRGLASHLGPRWSAKNLGVRKAPFYVLVGAHMPCVLAELAFIDNPLDGRNLQSERYLRDLAFGLYLGISNYLERYPPEEAA